MAPLPADHHGLITHASAAATGRVAQLEAAHRGGRLMRIRNGVYRHAAAGEPDSAPARDRQRYELLVRAAAHRQRAPVFTSYSAAILMGLPIIGRWPSTIYRLRPGPTGRRRGDVIDVASRKPIEPVAHEGALLTPIEFTLIQLARHAPLVCALAAWDAALLVPRAPGAEPITTPDQMAAEHHRLLPYHGSRRVEAVLSRASTASESALETLSGLTIEELGFPAPERQAHLWLPDLQTDAYVDFFWREFGIAGEADGYAKYVGGGEDAATRVLEEKRREDAIRRQVHGFARWTWADAWHRRGLEVALRSAGVPQTRARRLLR
ncbi:hypothetical protein [Ruania halotolerans]|uniref:hypothetical protein n=1 Tax=Ruania halotolerans TaxID=2897773 RepID=UPI001E313732|nr:hypothetical protein [Ruania halotolerans]UFU06504.1 hypothetical protein LQF10_19140 [Ruania halotolerans]